MTFFLKFFEPILDLASNKVWNGGIIIASFLNFLKEGK